MHLNTNPRFFKIKSLTTIQVQIILKNAELQLSSSLFWIIDKEIDLDLTSFNKRALLLKTVRLPERLINAPNYKRSRDLPESYKLMPSK